MPFAIVRRQPSGVHNTFGLSVNARVHDPPLSVPRRLPIIVKFQSRIYLSSLLTHFTMYVLDATEMYSMSNSFELLVVYLELKLAV